MVLEGWHTQVAMMMMVVVVVVMVIQRRLLAFSRGRGAFGDSTVQTNRHKHKHTT